MPASTANENRAYRESGIGRKHPLTRHYADGLKNGRARVKQSPHHQRWYEMQARSSARGPYANWPPYRAYQLGFARGTRALQHDPRCHRTVCHISCPIGD